MLFYTFIFPFGWINLRLITPPYLWIWGFRRMKRGTSTIWTPNNKKQAIVDGIELLRTRDPDMYLRLTEKQHLWIFYSGKGRATNALGYIFGLNQRYIDLGNEGVAAFLVQSLLLSEACPSLNQFKTTPGERAVMRKTLDWMCEHSFRHEMINSYRKVVEKWESQERFREIGQSPEMTN
jgi:hypothetical protein